MKFTFSHILIPVLSGTLLTANAFAQGPAPVTGLPGGGQAALAADPLIQAFNQAMVAFSAGDYQTAAKNLESVISQAAPDAQLESVYFTLGAAYYNLEQY